MHSFEISSLVSIIVLPLTFGIIKYAKSKVKDKVEIDSEFIKPFPFLKYLCLFCIILLLISSAGILLDTVTIKRELESNYIIILGICYLVAFVVLIYSVNWKIEIQEDFCIHTNIFGKKKKYLYKDLMVIKLPEAYKVCFNNHKVFIISTYLNNWKQFVDAYKKKNDIYIKK